MSLLISGILLLVTFMVVVMGVPFVSYLKRDMSWEGSRHKSFARWYQL